MHLNLLPVRFRVRLIVRTQLRHWSKLWGLCLILVAGVCGLQFWQVREARSQLERVQERSRPVREIGLKTVQLSQRLQQLEAEAERTETIQPVDRNLSLLGILGESVARTGGQVQVVRMTVHAVGQRDMVAKQPRRGAKKPAATIRRPSSVSIQGVALDDESLSKFVTVMRDFGVFENVDLKSSNRLAAAVGGGGREFQLECTFQ